MDLCTLERVKDSLGKSLDTEDVPIVNLIAEVSHEIEQYLDRVIQNTGSDRTEVHDVKKGQFKFLVDAFPIVTVTSVKNAWDRDFGSATALDSSNYYVDKEGGSINIDRVGLTTGAGTLQVIYQGGMAADTDAFMAAYPDITGACVSEVIFRYLRRTRPGVVTEAISGATITVGQRNQFLVSVENVLSSYVRSFTAV